ncbi:hypothetical protein V5799_000293 [Amblyomma americanum]|uniref:Uncharacterized protein n=1 Tax=Amblyomma americanum TaxID=6943 RepID=A0AAQ4D3G5_AMBAM
MMVLSSPMSRLFITGDLDPSDDSTPEPCRRRLLQSFASHVARTALAVGIKRRQEKVQGISASMVRRSIESAGVQLSLNRGQPFAAMPGSCAGFSGGANMFRKKREVKTVVLISEAENSLLLPPAAPAMEKSPPSSVPDHPSSILQSNKQDQRLLHRFLEDTAEPVGKKAEGAWAQLIPSPSPPGTTCFASLSVTWFRMAELTAARRRLSIRVPLHQPGARPEFAATVHGSKEAFCAVDGEKRGRSGPGDLLFGRSEDGASVSGCQPLAVFVGHCTRQR